MAFTSASLDGQFPILHDGDVEICLSRKPQDRFVLHSVTLSLHSPFFKASLSDRWMNSDSIESEAQTKWKYQLRFEPESEDAILLRAQDVSMNVPESPGLDTDTTSIFLNEAPWIPKDDALTRSRQTAIMAHRQFFGVLFHQPLSISNRSSGSLLNSLRHLVAVADAYQSLHVVAVPIDNYMVLHVSPDVAQFYSKQPQELLYLAISLKCKWLFREVVCRLIGDPTKDDEKIMQMFSTYGTASLIVQKRILLRHMMSDVVAQILSLTTSDLPDVYKGYSHRVLFIGMAQFKEDMVEHLSTWKDSKWSCHALRFHRIRSHRKYLPCPKWYRTTLRSLGLAESQDVDQISKDLDVVYTSLSERAVEKIAPLFVSVVSKPLLKEGDQQTAGDTKNPEIEGFTCIDITDSDLPWELSQ